MKTNEFMVGDWFAVCGTPLQIAAIGTHKAGFIDEKGEMFYHYYNTLKPIALTSEILDNNGFKMDEVVNENFPGGTKQWVYEDAECLICVSESGITWWLEIELQGYAGCIEMIVDDVHELQHAINLFGITKKIEL